MIKINNRTQWTSRLAILIGVIGISPLAGLPALAQTESNQLSASKEAKAKVVAQSSTSTQSKNLVTLAKEAGSFKTLLRAGEAAGLLNTIAGGTYTVLAPDDGAVAATIPQSTLEAALQPENKALLKEILLYHVVPGRVTPSQLKTGTLKTLGGGVSVQVDSGKIVFNDASVIEAAQASNGYGYRINRVLIPDDIQKKYAAQLTAQ